MTLQALTPKWLASPEGQEWKKKNQEVIDKAFADALNEVEIPLKQEKLIDNINHVE